MLHDVETIGGSPAGLRDEYTNRILLEAAESLDLSPTQHKEAQESYLAVGSWLDAPDSPLRRFRPSVYAQGSFALGTCVKPLGRDDFDLDAVCELLVSASVTPAELKKLIGDCLRAHGQYRTMLEEKARCWRLNYARDFHLDIIPAKPKWPGTDNTSIYITDRELRTYLDSNPKGYVSWFDEQKRITTTPTHRGTLQAKVAPAPAYTEAKHKAPLQITIQLLKRHRDVTFQGRDDAPISVIITTLAAKVYQQESSVLATLRGIIDRMPSGIDYSRGYARIANPTNEAENFADKWRANPEREQVFYEWNSRVRGDLRRLEAATGMPQVRSALIPFFGERRADLILNRLASTTAEQRDSGLKVDSKTGLVGGIQRLHCAKIELLRGCPRLGFSGLSLSRLPYRRTCSEPPSPVPHAR